MNDIQRFMDFLEREKAHYVPSAKNAHESAVIMYHEGAQAAIDQITHMARRLLIESADFLAEPVDQAEPSGGADATDDAWVAALLAGDLQLGNDTVIVMERTGARWYCEVLRAGVEYCGRAVGSNPMEALAAARERIDYFVANPPIIRDMGKPLPDDDESDGDDDDDTLTDDSTYGDGDDDDADFSDDDDGDLADEEPIAVAPPAPVGNADALIIVGMTPGAACLAESVYASLRGCLTGVDLTHDRMMVDETGHAVIRLEFRPPLALAMPGISEHPDSGTSEVSSPAAPVMAEVA